MLRLHGLRSGVFLLRKVCRIYTFAKLHTELLDYNLRSIALTYVKSSVNVSVAVMWPWFDLHIWCCRGRDGAFLLEFQCGRIAVATPGGISW